MTGAADVLRALTTRSGGGLLAMAEDMICACKKVEQYSAGHSAWQALAPLQGHSAWLLQDINSILDLIQN